MYDETNGVGVAARAATEAALVEDPTSSVITVRAVNRWVDGGYSRTLVPSGSWPADLPESEGGAAAGPTPSELLLHALASCLSASVVIEATRRGVTMIQVEASVEADVDQRFAFGLDAAGGLGPIRVSFRVVTDARPEVIDEALDEARRRAPVLDAVMTGVPVIVEKARIEAPPLSGATGSESDVERP